MSQNKRRGRQLGHLSIRRDGAASARHASESRRIGDALPSMVLLAPNVQASIHEALVNNHAGMSKSGADPICVGGRRRFGGAVALGEPSSASLSLVVP